MRSTLNSSARSLIPNAAFQRGDVDAQLFQLLQCRFGVAPPGLGVTSLGVSDLARRLSQQLLDGLRLSDPPRPHQGRHRRAELADRQLRNFFLAASARSLGNRGFGLDYLGHAHRSRVRNCNAPCPLVEWNADGQHWSDRRIAEAFSCRIKAVGDWETCRLSGPDLHSCSSL